MREKYFITGATGLIGRELVEHLSKTGEDVVVYVRDRKKAEGLFSHLEGVTILEGFIEAPISYEQGVDYIIHAAAPTESRFFVEQPVETISSIVFGAKHVLDLARQKKVKSMVNLSSMEVYGAPTDEEILTEDQQFYLNPLSVRSNYPLAKRLVENMCVAYHLEYGVAVKSARLAQVLGKKIHANDNRVIAQFIRAAQNHVDIELATDGMTKQTYVSLDDSVNGVLTILHKGEDGSAYNVANEETYRSIRELAELVVSIVAEDKIQIKTNSASNESRKYPPNRTLRLNSDKLRLLGWEPRISLEDAIEMLASGGGRQG